MNRSAGTSKANQRVDWFPVAIKFAVGAVFGAPSGLLLAMRSSHSDLVHPVGLVGGALLFGAASAILGRRLWEGIASARCSCRDATNFNLFHSDETGLADAGQCANRLPSPADGGWRWVPHWKRVPDRSADGGWHQRFHLFGHCTPCVLRA